jgi:HSP20 family protein
MRESEKEEVKSMSTDQWRTRPHSSAVDRLFREALEPYFVDGTSNAANGGTTGFQSLPVNVWETVEGYEATFLAPGLDEQSINVTVHDDTLSIEGEQRFEVPAGAKMVWQEFGPATYRRSLRLGAAIDSAKVEALYRNGLLTLRLQKAEHARPRHIKVQMGQGEAAPDVIGVPAST